MKKYTEADIENLTDQTELENIAKDRHIYPPFRMMAADKLDDPRIAQEAYAEIAMNGFDEKDTRQKAFEKLTDEDLHERVISYERYQENQRKGIEEMEKAKRLIKEKVSPNSACGLNGSHDWDGCVCKKCGGNKHEWTDYDYDMDWCTKCGLKIFSTIPTQMQAVKEDKKEKSAVSKVEEPPSEVAEENTERQRCQGECDWKSTSTGSGSGRVTDWCTKCGYYSTYYDDTGTDIAEGFLPSTCLTSKGEYWADATF